MGCHQSCLAADQTRTINPDADFDGPGVLISFFVTDAASIVASIAVSCHKTLGIGERGVTVWRKLLLSLSDQQLVAGIAICLSAYASICSTQLHDFLNAAHFALLSFVVHVLTITTLQRQFRHNRGSLSLYVRLGMVGVNLFLLSPIFYHLAFTTGGTFNPLLEVYPASCMLAGALRGSTTAGGWVIFGLVVLLMLLTCGAVWAYVFIDPVDPVGLEKPGLLQRSMPYLAGSLVFVCVCFALSMTAMRVSGATLGNLAVGESTGAAVWGFGQILAIAMLLLTLLTLLEMEEPEPAIHEGQDIELQPPAAQRR